MTFLAGAGLLLLVAKVADPAGLELPFMEGGAREDDGSTTATIRCKRIATDKASCTVLETVLREPKVDPAEKAEFKKQTQGKEGEAEFKTMCSNIDKKPSLVAAPVVHQLVERTKAACAAKDAAALRAAFRWWVEEVVERTCKLSVFSYTLDLSRVDSNTWRSIETTGTCGGTTIYSLSRKPGAFSWVFDTIRTVPRSSQNDPLCKNPSGGTTETVTFGKTYLGPRELHCRYWDAP